MTPSGVQGFRPSPQQLRVWSMQQEWGTVLPARLKVRVEGELERSLLERAVERVVTRHEILRTTFRSLPGVSVPLQVVGETASVLRVDLDTLADGRQELRLELPALCADAASLELLLGEIVQEYAGREAEGVVLQYPDFSEWQNALLESEETEEGRAFWRARPAPAALRLPFTVKRSTFVPVSIAVPLDAGDVEGVARLASSLGATPVAVLLALWQTLLHRFTAQEEIAVGVLAEGRSYEGLESSIGLLARYLPLGCRLDASTPFRDAVTRAAEELEVTAAWQEFFDWNLLPGGPQRLLAGFDFAKRMPGLESGAARFSEPIFEVPGEPFAVKLSVSWCGETLSLRLAYDAGAVEEEDAQRLAAALRALLAAAIVDPGERVGSLPLLGRCERAALIAASAGPEGRWGAGCVHLLIQGAVEEMPESVAVVHEDRFLSYRELGARADDLARRLRAAGVGPDSIVAISLERSLEIIVAILGTFRAGGAYLPLDPGLPVERRAFMLEDSGAVAMVTVEALRPDLPAAAAQVICLDDPRGATGRAGTLPRAEVAPENLAYILYTSGSSGTPKAVQVEHRQLWNYIHAITEVLGLSPGASWAMVSTFAADLGNTALFSALCRGGVLHVVSQDLTADPHALAESFERHGIDALKIVPSHLEALLAAKSDPRLMPRKCLVLGGEACRWEWIDRLRALAPGCRIFNHYGPTETTVGTSTFRLGTEGSRRSVAPPIGKPLASSRIHLLDTRLEPVPCWVPAELYVAGLGVSRGYLGRPDLTAERFLPDPLAPLPGERLYRTGDLARRLPDGNLEFLGRADDQVKIRGYRVELGEVAAALERHPAVTRAEVLSRETGEGQKRLVAYVTVRRGEVAADHLRAFLRERLPEFMIPTFFVVMDALPLMANGKIDRRALPAPREERPLHDGSTPRNAVEAKLVDVWKAVLGLANVGIEDNFFALGGDSILGIQVVARARQEGLVLHPADLFRYPTVAELALVAGTDGAAIVAPQGPVVGPVALTPIQRRFFELDVPEPHHWNQSLLLEARRRLDPRAVATAVEHLLAHHDALRLRFRRGEEAWRQENTPAEGPVPLSWLDLSALPEGAVRAAIEAAAAQTQTSLDLSRGPMLRVVVFDLGSSRPGRLLMTAHHLVVDGVSWRILLEDLGTAYTQASVGAVPQLPAKTSPYQLWAERLLDHARGPETAAELEIWLEQEGRRPPPLPRDTESSLPDTEGRAERVCVALEAEATEALLRDVPEAYQSQIQEVLLTALVRAFARWTGSPVLQVELEGHGREDLFSDVDVSRTVGWFTSRFPVVLDLGRTASPGDALKSLKEQLRRLPRRGIGYGLLRYLGAGDGLRTRPAPEVSFNYLGQLGDLVSGESLFGPARESVGQMRSPAAPRGHLFQIEAIIAGELQVVWVYSPARHRRDTVELLAASFLDELRGLIDHCRSPEAGSYTPSDFPDLELSQRDLDSILDQVVGG